MTKPNDYALILGIHAYRTYDPSGRSDVAGALNDARAWVRQCLSMGFSPERIRVLTTPVLAASELGPLGESIHRGEATHDGIVDGITWLITELGGEALAAGVMTFSGHGEASGGDPLLSCADGPRLLRHRHRHRGGQDLRQRRPAARVARAACAWPA